MHEEIWTKKCPLWAFPDKDVKKEDDGKNTKFEYHFCKNTYIETYSRVYAHLLKIPSKWIALWLLIPEEEILQLK